MRFRFTLSVTDLSLPELSDYTNVASGTDWATGEPPSLTLASTVGAHNGNLLAHTYPFVEGYEYTISYNIDYIIGADASVNSFKIKILRSDNSLISESNGDSFAVSTAGEHSGTYSFSAPNGAAKISFHGSVTNSGGIGGVYYEISSYSVLTEHEINEPDGWKESILRLVRHPDFHSLVEEFDGEFIFYGNNGRVDGGINFIRDVESNNGFDTELGILIEASYDGYTYETIFEGLLDLPNLEEFVDNKMMVPIIPNSIWTKLINRRNTPVDLSSTTTLDGEECLPVTPVTIHLTSQKIRYNGQYSWKDTVTYSDEFSGMQLDWDEVIVDDIKKFNLPRVGVDVSTTPTLLIVADTTPIFEAEWEGEYTFDIRIEMANYTGTDWESATSKNIWIQKDGEPDGRQQFNETVETYGSDSIVVFSYSGTWYLAKGEQIEIYGQGDNNSRQHTIFGSVLLDWLTDCVVATTGNITLSGTQTIDGIGVIAGDRVLVKNQNDSRFNGIYVCAAGAWSRASDADTSAELQNAAVEITSGTDNANTLWFQREPNIEIDESAITFVFKQSDDTRLKAYPGPGIPDTHLNITADTVFEETEAECYFIHDAIAGVIKRICGCEFYSEVLGSTLTNERQYEENGCGSQYIIIKGSHIRGYTLSERKFFASLNNLWDGINPILNLGLGYETSEDSPNVPQIRLEDKSHFYQETRSINFSDIRQLRRYYDGDRIFKTIKVGYKKWKSENISGIDDPQTKRTYATKFKTSGTDLDIESDFIASSSAIEFTMRATIDKTADYKFDDDIFIISVDLEDSSPEVYYPELDENFSEITNLTNSDSKYNLALTPLRNFLRWTDYISGCLQGYLTSSFKFVSGEGNYTMTSDYICGADRQCIAIICDSVAENQDIPLGAPTNYYIPFGYIHLPFEYDISNKTRWEEYKIIRNLPKQAIGISQTDEDHISFFIKDFAFKPAVGTSNLKAWPLELLAVNDSELLVVSIETISTISIPKTVLFQSLFFRLPATVRVTYSNGQTERLDVTWAEGAYDETTSGTYTLSGQVDLPDGVINPSGLTAEIQIEVVSALDPDSLTGKVLWARENNINDGTFASQWTNKWNGSNDLLALTDGDNPDYNAAGLNGNPTYGCVIAENNGFQSEATLGLTGDFTYSVVFRNNDPSLVVGQIILENTDNGVAFGNTGLQAQVREDQLLVDFRMNDAVDFQRITFGFTNTDWNVLSVKHISDGNASINIVKFNGKLIDKQFNREAVVHNSNLLKVGRNGFNNNVPFEGEFAEIFINSVAQDSDTEKQLLTYMENRHASVDFTGYYDDDDLFRLDDFNDKRWNGLDKKLRDDNKYDFIGGSLTGELYYFEQGDTVYDWTQTLLADVNREIQSLAILGRDSSGRLVIATVHKDSVIDNDEIGKVMIHRADTSDDKGSYSSVNIITNRRRPQDIIVYDVDGSGRMQFVWSYQGSSAGQGGIMRFTCLDEGDVLTASNWEEDTIRVHESAWWMERATINGSEGILFTARQNGINSAQVPGIYFIAQPDDVTGVWPLTTIDSTLLDWGHADVGNIFGGDGNDIIAMNFSGDDEVFAYDAGNSYAKSTLITRTSAEKSYNLKCSANLVNGRNWFIHIVENDWAYRTYWDGSQWVSETIFSTIAHPSDNEALHVDADDSGVLRWFMDFSSDPFDNIKSFI
jgi:hypothetical protein